MHARKTDPEADILTCATWYPMRAERLWQYATASAAITHQASRSSGRLTNEEIAHQEFHKTS